MRRPVLALSAAAALACACGAADSPRTPRAPSVASAPPSTGRPRPVDAPARDVDGSLPAAATAQLLGAGATRALLRVRAGEASYLGLWDLASGCVKRTHPVFARLAELEDLDRDAYERRSEGATLPARRATALSLLGAPETKRELSEMLTLAREAEADQARPFAWSEDGTHVAAAVAGALFVSWDRGATFAMVDDHDAASPAFAPGGDTLFFERCARADTPYHCAPEFREVAVLAAKASAPRPTRIGAALVAGVDRERGHVVLARDGEGAKLCIDRLAADGAITRAFCVDARVQRPGEPPPLSVSSRGAWAAFDIKDKKRARLFVFDLRSGARAHLLDGLDATQVELDERGLVAWEEPTTHHAIITSPSTRRDVGPGRPLGWTRGGALLVWTPPAPQAKTLGDVACAQLRAEPAAP
jgi:hypothetical protein